MLLSIGRLQRPIAQQAVRNAPKTSTIAGRLYHSNVSAEPSSPRTRTQTRSIQSSMSNHLDATSSRSRTLWRHLQWSGIRFSHSQNGLPHRAFIALGSNMGDSVAMIEQALTEMEATRQVRILQTSSLYETKAMYVLDQDNFVNGACEVDGIVPT
jgi:2-amino-4-hydroxy-6-hydroxymethyldihydropteridine diphosphokinase/dihydropteroate synthase